MMGIIGKIFGTKHDRDLKKFQPVVDEINQHFVSFANLSEEELKGKTDEFRGRIAKSTREATERLNRLQEDLDKGEDGGDRQGLLDEI
ncbi:MAG: hypothetical protein O2954_06460 [bacterium]|nr:hypothetical protein [bacterium]